jgi:LPXTG-motif cell wall-anchored protein
VLFVGGWGEVLDQILKDQPLWVVLIAGALLIVGAAGWFRWRNRK